MQGLHVSCFASYIASSPYVLPLPRVFEFSFLSSSPCWFLILCVGSNLATHLGLLISAVFCCVDA